MKDSGKLVPGFCQGADIHSFEISQYAALAVAQLGGGGGIDAAAIVHKVFRAVVHGRGVEGVARIEQFQVAAVHVDAVQVRKVGVFARFAPAGVDVQNMRLFVYARNVLARILAGRDLREQFAAWIVPIPMPPPVTLRPEQNVFVVFAVFVGVLAAAFLHTGNQVQGCVSM